jgi:hypothetical protein
MGESERQVTARFGGEKGPKNNPNWYGLGFDVSDGRLQSSFKYNFSAKVTGE